MKKDTAHLQAEMPSGLLTEQRLWGTPARSDAAFLVALRSRLSGRQPALWLPFRQVAGLCGLALLLIVGLWLPVGTAVPQLAVAEQEDLEVVVDEFVETETTIEDLEVYLDSTFPEESVELGEKYIESDPSAAELLTVDAQEFDLVLAELEDTEFF